VARTCLLIPLRLMLCRSFWNGSQFNFEGSISPA
jgi:hypothetical protein